MKISSIFVAFLENTNFTKEKSIKKEPENHSGETEDLLKKQVEAEMKREEKNKRKFFKVRGNIDIVKDLSSGVVYSIIGEKKKRVIDEKQILVIALGQLQILVIARPVNYRWTALTGIWLTEK